MTEKGAAVHLFRVLFAGKAAAAAYSSVNGHSRGINATLAMK